MIRRTPASMPARCILLAVIATTALASCGTSSQPAPAPTRTAAAASTATPGPTHAAFTQALDKTCHGSTADLTAAANNAGDNTTKLAGIVGQTAARIEHVIAEQKALTAPAQDRAAFRAYMAAQARAAGLYRRMQAALRAGDVAETRYLLSLTDGVRAARTSAALDLGLRKCGG